MTALALFLNDGNRIPQIGLGMVVALAARHGKTPAQIVLRWHIELGLVAIPKSANPVRIAQNIDIFNFALTNGEVAALSALDTGAEIGVDSDTMGH
jgi:2,5-diketo-D-gluconate reductase A